MPGEYVIPDNHTIVKSGLNVTIRPTQRKSIKDPRCKDCANFGKGKAVRGWFVTTVCFKMPKSIRQINGDTEQYYYCAKPTGGKRCPMFERKGGKE